MNGYECENTERLNNGLGSEMMTEEQKENFIMVYVYCVVDKTILFIFLLNCVNHARKNIRIVIVQLMLYSLSGRT